MSETVVQAKNGITSYDYSADQLGDQKDHYVAIAILDRNEGFVERTVLHAEDSQMQYDAAKKEKKLEDLLKKAQAKHVDLRKNLTEYMRAQEGTLVLEPNDSYLGPVLDAWENYRRETRTDNGKYVEGRRNALKNRVRQGVFRPFKRKFRNIEKGFYNFMGHRIGHDFSNVPSERLYEELERIVDSDEVIARKITPFFTEIEVFEATKRFLIERDTVLGKHAANLYQLNPEDILPVQQFVELMANVYRAYNIPEVQSQLSHKQSTTLRIKVANHFTSYFTKPTEISISDTKPSTLIGIELEGSDGKTCKPIVLPEIETGNVDYEIADINMDPYSTDPEKVAERMKQELKDFADNHSFLVLHEKFSRHAKKFSRPKDF